MKQKQCGSGGRKTGKQKENKLSKSWRNQKNKKDKEVKTEVRDERTKSEMECYLR